MLEVMALPQVSLGVIALMRERGGVGSAGFWIFDDDLVALETPTASIQVSQPAEIGLYARICEELKRSTATAVSPVTRSPRRAGRLRGRF
ncbi:hypothetical protein AB0G00_36930 [Nocardia salmonicida]|uniref:hypothetical protein n=1 Tax=Nocardia salmonicida TaxID=53431 RepID=UPI0033D6ADD0